MIFRQKIVPSSMFAISMNVFKNAMQASIRKLHDFFLKFDTFIIFPYLFNQTLCFHQFFLFLSDARFLEKIARRLQFLQCSCFFSEI